MEEDGLLILMEGWNRKVRSKVFFFFHLTFYSECIVYRLFIGHPIGATGLAQCAELVYQVSVNDFKIVNFRGRNYHDFTNLMEIIQVYSFKKKKMFNVFIELEEDLICNMIYERL